MVVENPRVITWLVVGVILLFHLIIAPLVPLGVDEAHYALYALHPDLSYFDHPPMVAWLQMLVAPLNYNEFSIRLVPSILYAVVSIQVYRLSGKLYPDAHKNESLIAVLLVNSAPILQLMGWGLVPDLPLMVLALFALELTLKISKQHLVQDWLLLGVVYGLAGLSKYTAIFLPFGMIIFLCQTQGFCWLKRLSPWLAVVPALIFISPVLIWNFKHEWASFTYQINHASGHEWALKNVLSMQLLQMVCYSPLSYIGGIAATVFSIRRGRIEDWLVVWSVWPFLLVTTWSAGSGALLPNWPAMGWTLLAPLTAHWVCLYWNKQWVKVLAGLSTMLSVGLIVFIFGFLAFQPLSWFQFMKPVVRDLVGWDQAASRAKALLVEMKRVEGGSPVLLVESWSKASRIAWYGQPLPVQVLSARRSQFSEWFGAADEYTRGILIRENEDVPISGIYRKRGLKCQYIGGQEGVMDGITVNLFHFYRCQPEVEVEVED